MIVDDQGRVLGRHDGYFRYTVGQRRGLGVALGEPAYVSDIDPDTGRVTVSNRASVQHRRITLTDCNWFDRPAPDQQVRVRVRHRGRLAPCRVRTDGELVQVDLDEPVHAAAPGQAAVFYDGDRVLGGGWIVGAEVGA